MHFRRGRSQFVTTHYIMATYGRDLGTGTWGGWLGRKSGGKWGKVTEQNCQHAA